MAIAICDTFGDLAPFTRMDGDAFFTCDSAQNKDYTSSASGLATHEWYELTKAQRLLETMFHMLDLVTFADGYPVCIDGQTVGGIGVRSGHYRQDIEVASTAK